MLIYEGYISQEKFQEHPLLDHDINDVNFAAITYKTTALIMPNVLTSITFQVTLIVNFCQPLIKELKYPRLWDHLVQLLKVIRLVNSFLIQLL